MLRDVVRVLAQRVLTAIPILLVVSILLFTILRLIPVDPLALSVPPNATIKEIDQIRHQMGFDRPIAVQYLVWLRNTLHLDFGQSIQHRESVARLIAGTLPATIELAFFAIVIASALGLVGGLLLFHLRDRPGEVVADLASTAIMSLPDFLWGLLFILLFGVALEWLPFIGRLAPTFSRPPVHTGFLLIDALIDGRFDVFLNVLKHMLLPAFALGLSFSPPIMRVLRSSLHDVYAEDYIQQARLRGIGEWRILVRHATKNAILPTLTLMGVQFNFLFGGTLLIEVIYSYPGMGNLMVEAVRNADLPIIQAVGLVYCVIVLIINAIVDMSYVILNPKLRRQ
jgi:ABC-type dipeptide/oligopeptide/nickel transport system permease component